MQEIDAYCGIKMLLLQSSNFIQNKDGLKKAQKFKCLNKKCVRGWFSPGDQTIFARAFETFNADQERTRNLADMTCQLCKKVYESNQTSALQRCELCKQA
jgi:hypothetical protein